MATGRSGRTAPRVAATSGAETKPAPTPAADSTSAMLDDLLGRTGTVIDAIEKHEAPITDLAGELTKLGQAIDQDTEAIVSTDDKERIQALLKEAETRIRTGTVDTLNRDSKAHLTDLNEALASVQALWKTLGRGLDNLEKPTAEDNQRLADSEAEVEVAKAAVEEAKGAFFFRGSKTETADTQLAEAEAALERTKVENARIAKERVRNADYRSAYQRIVLMCERIQAVIHQTYQETVDRLQITQQRREEVLELKQEAAELLQKLEAELKVKEGDYQAAAQALADSTHLNGTPEYVKQERVVARLRSEVGKLTGQRTATLGVLHSKERFGVHLPLAETALESVASNLLAAESILASDTAERVYTFEARLQIQKGTQDQAAALDVTKVGREEDASTLEMTAAYATAANRATVALMEGQKAGMQRLTNVGRLMAEEQAIISQRVEDILAETQARYGTNVADESYTNYRDQPAAPAPKAE